MNKEHIDNFEVDFKAEYDSIHPNIQYDDAELVAAIEEAPIKIHVLFAYSDHSFSGTFHNCRFWRT